MLEMRRFRNTSLIAILEGIWPVGVTQPRAKGRTSAWHQFLRTGQAQFRSGRKRAHNTTPLRCLSVLLEYVPTTFGKYSLLSPPAMPDTVQLSVPFLPGLYDSRGSPWISRTVGPSSV